jgi:hypothetical protein
MDHIRILKRALEITRAYRALWLFGFILALTTNRGGGNNSGYQFSDNDFGRQFPTPDGFPNFNFLPQLGNTIIAIVVGVICFILLLSLVLTVLRYVSLTSLVRMVNGYEETGEKLGVRQGWRLGWSRAAWRTFLVDLLFGLGGFIAFIVLLALAASPALLWLTQNETAGTIGTVIAVALGVVVIFAFVLIAIALSVLSEFFHRAIILEGLGVFDGIRRGWEVARRRLFGLSLASVIIFIPIVLLLLVVALVTGGLPALLAGAITNIFVHGNTPQIVALIVGIPIFLLTLIIPLSFVSGLIETYFSSVWTLTYREIVALESVGTSPEAPLAPAAE